MLPLTIYAIILTRFSMEKSFPFVSMKKFHIHTHIQRQHQQQRHSQQQKHHQSNARKYHLVFHSRLSHLSRDRDFACYILSFYILYVLVCVPLGCAFFGVEFITAKRFFCCTIARMLIPHRYRRNECSRFLLFGGNLFRSLVVLSFVRIHFPILLRQYRVSLWILLEYSCVTNSNRARFPCRIRFSSMSHAFEDVVRTFSFIAKLSQYTRTFCFPILGSLVSRWPRFSYSCEITLTISLVQLLNECNSTNFDPHLAFAGHSAIYGFNE